MGLWLSKSIVSTSLGITYVIWVGLVVVSIVISIPIIYDSPYHQMMFRRMKEAKKQGKTVEDEEFDRAKRFCHENHQQDLFPSGDVMKTFKESGKRYIKVAWIMLMDAMVWLCMFMGLHIWVCI